MPFFPAHPNGHERRDIVDELSSSQETMTIEEEDDCFVAGFLRPLMVESPRSFERPEAEMEPQQSSNLTDVGSSPTGATTLDIDRLDNEGGAIPCS